MEKAISILIGCDDTGLLAIMLKCLKGSAGNLFDIISVSRECDVQAISKSINPGLIILAFRTNQRIVNDISGYISQSQIPVLCLMKRYSNEMLSWGHTIIAFTFLIENIINQDSFLAQVRSIVLLKKSSSVKNNFTSLAEKAWQESDNRNTSRYVLELDQKVHVLSDVRQRIENLFVRVDDPIREELISIVNAIKVSAMDKKLWDDFKLYFEQINPGFLFLLLKKHPHLTQKDLKYCCYIKMNMSNDDIRNLLGINQESVRTHKYRLKKKLALNEESDLQKYIQYFDGSEDTFKLDPVAESWA